MTADRGWWRHHSTAGLRCLARERGDRPDPDRREPEGGRRTVRRRDPGGRWSSPSGRIHPTASPSTRLPRSRRCGRPCHASTTWSSSIRSGASRRRTPSSASWPSAGRGATATGRSSSSYARTSGGTTGARSPLAMSRPPSTSCERRPRRRLDSASTPARTGTRMFWRWRRPTPTRWSSSSGGPSHPCCRCWRPATAPSTRPTCRPSATARSASAPGRSGCGSGGAAASSTTCATRTTSSGIARTWTAYATWSSPTGAHGWPRSRPGRSTLPSRPSGAGAWPRS